MHLGAHGARHQTGQFFLVVLLHLLRGLLSDAAVLLQLVEVLLALLLLGGQSTQLAQTLGRDPVLLALRYVRNDAGLRWRFLKLA